MKKIIIIPWSRAYHGNALFDLNGPLNRDNSLFFWHTFRNHANRLGWHVESRLSLAKADNADFYVILDPSPEKISALSVRQKKRALAIFCEPEITHPLMYQRAHLERISRELFAVYCYSPLLCVKYGFIRIPWYADLYQTRESSIIEPALRSGICMIAQNKPVENPRHIKSLLEFRSQLPSQVARDSILRYEFKLYGRGWNKAIGKISSRLPHYAISINIISALVSRIERQLPANKHINIIYHGNINSKRNALCKTRFYLIVENMRCDGYVTEKIFDALQYGAIPIYYGEPDIEEIVSPSVYINGNNFSTPLSAMKYALALTESNQREIIDAGVQWMQSSTFANRFGRESRINSIMKLAEEVYASGTSIHD